MLLVLCLWINADAKPLNMGLEAGSLESWTAEGDAFTGQPVRGDTVAVRRKEMKSNHVGEFWIGGYEIQGDKAKGTLTSAAFTVSQPWATFLIGGGSGDHTRIEILHDSKVIFKAHGADTESMSRVAVDLAKYLGKPIQIRLVDNAIGGWGHINYDDFVFAAEEPKGIARQASPTHADEMKNAGLSPEKAAAAMTVPEGFHVTLFAGEPDVHQPVAFCFDDRGRLWVVEAFQYPTRHSHPGPVIPDKTKGDKVLIFEDVDGDGKFDKRTVFMEGLNLVSGIEYGFGGIYLGAAPYLLHIPVKDDMPAGQPVILLDGWGYEDTHETLNSFTWGPDGWLYGCHGVFTNSNVGKPGTSEKQRVPINAGVWRYHPTRKIFERFAEGTSNPWGLDYNQYGDFFVEACVIPHLFHIVQGGRYTRQAREHFNPHTYIEIPTIADHLHYLGATPHGGNNKSDGAGGGHAHCGLMCYQGGAWPKEYHGQLFMGNIHGRRINMDVLTPKGSSYVASHGKDFLLANDAWARFIAMKYGPDGNMYVIDWYDAQACHRKEPEIWDRTNGRIYKVSYRGTKPVVNLDLNTHTDAGLLQLQLQDNQWLAGHARRILQERFSGNLAGRDTKAFDQIYHMINSLKYAQYNLNLLWTGYCTRTLSQSNIDFILHVQENEVMRANCVSLLFQCMYLDGLDRENTTEDGETLIRTFWSTHIGYFYQKASMKELRDFAGLIPRFSKPDQMRLLKNALVSRCNTIQSDPILLHLFWCSLEPLIQKTDLNLLAFLRDETKATTLLKLAVKRAVSMQDDSVDLQVLELASSCKNEEKVLLILSQLSELQGDKSGTNFSKAWIAIRDTYRGSKNEILKRYALQIDCAIRDLHTLAEILNRTVDPKTPELQRVAYFHLLVAAKYDKLAEHLNRYLDDSTLRAPALRAMASLGNELTPKSILDYYRALSTIEKRDAIATLASKPSFAMALLDAIAAKTIPAADVPAETIRLLRAFKDEKLNAKVVAVWGTLRDTPADRKKLIAQWRSKLTLSHDPDLPQGRAVYAKVCAQCHMLYGTGAAVGPDITGSNRADLAYLLENVFDPNAVIPKEYSATTFDLLDGRKITGIVKSETAAVVTVATATETVKINVADIEKRTGSEFSMMPDDLTKQLTETEVKNLIAYLRHPSQVPMKATPDNAKEFFNSKDLSNWDGDKALWTVDNGEIVGKSEKGLKANQFLTSNLEVSDFKLSFQVKLTPAKENSGVQFRSVRIPGTEMRGPQADIGQGWWGKLYEESGRGLLVKEGGEKHVKKEEWNEYVLEAKGTTVKIWINGNLVCDYTDEKLSRKGLIGLQAHSGGPLEVRFKDLKLEVLP